MNTCVQCGNGPMHDEHMVVNDPDIKAHTFIPQMEHTDGFWIGRLAMASALAAKRGDEPSKEIVQEFLRSPLPSSELRAMLKEEMKR